MVPMTVLPVSTLSLIFTVSKGFRLLSEKSEAVASDFFALGLGEFVAYLILWLI